MNALRITILVDNYVRRRGLLAEHGWACWVETPVCRVLFDTGQGHVLLHNARELGIPLETADAIVLSHGHYDHTGALATVLSLAPAARVFAHPAALEAKYKRAPNGNVRAIGLPTSPVESLAHLLPRVVPTRTPTEIHKGLWVTGEVPRVTDFEDPGSGFCVDAAGDYPDPLIDDQALAVRAQTGVVVVLGCAHAGVINTLRFVQTLHPRNKLAAVLGGMHLYAATEERITRTAAALAALDVKRVVPAHCTGLPAMAALLAKLSDRCTFGEVGARFDFTMALG